MGFASEAQRNYMHKHLPEIAARWEKETAGKLPKYVKDSPHDPMNMLKKGMKELHA